MNQNNLFSTKSVLASFDIEYKPSDFINSLFFSEVQTFDNSSVEVQYRKGTRTMAPFVHPLLPSQVKSMTGYSSELYEPPTLKPARLIQTSDFQKAAFSENAFSKTTLKQRFKQVYSKNWTELEKEIKRRIEYMSVQLMFEGKIDISGDGVNDVIDFSLPNKITVSDNKKWTNFLFDIQKGIFEVDPVEDLEKWRMLVLKNGGLLPNIAIMDYATAEIFMSHPAVKEKLDVRRNGHLSINPSFLENEKVLFVGRLSSGLEIYGYNDFYEKSTGDLLPFVKSGQVLLSSTAMKGKTLFGAVSYFDEGDMVTKRDKFVPRVITNQDTGTTMRQELISKPLVIPDNTHNWLVADVF